MEASLGDNVDLDGGVATRVVDGAGVNLSDRHLGCLKESSVCQSSEVLGWRVSSGSCEVGSVFG